VTLGLDISTTCIGYALFNEDGDLLKIGHVSMNSKQTIFAKLKQFQEHMQELSQLEIKHIAVEEPLKKFAGKFSSASTIALLNQFNGMVSAVCYLTWGIEPVYYNVNAARHTAYPNIKFGQKSSEAKSQVREQVQKLEPHLNWIYGPKSRKLVDANFDMADAYTVGLCHLVTLEKQAELQKK
jgi:Holliday junction resolvasome RuvABC endonuclease subunit